MKATVALKISLAIQTLSQIMKIDCSQRRKFQSTKSLIRLLITLVSFDGILIFEYILILMDKFTEPCSLES